MRQGICKYWNPIGWICHLQIKLYLTVKREASRVLMARINYPSRKRLNNYPWLNSTLWFHFKTAQVVQDRYAQLVNSVQFPSDVKPCFIDFHLILSLNKYFLVENLWTILHVWFVFAPPFANVGGLGLGVMWFRHFAFRFQTLT